MTLYMFCLISQQVMRQLPKQQQQPSLAANANQAFININAN